MLLGSVQGIVFSAIVLFSKKYKSQSNFFLAFLILAIALNNLQYFLQEAEIVNIQLFFSYIYFPFASLIMVFYFFYVKFFLYPENHISKKQIALFLPFLFFFCVVSYYKVNHANSVMSVDIIDFFWQLTYLEELFGVIYSLVLLFASYLLILQFENGQISGKSQIPKTNLTWLKVISAITFVLCLLWLVSIVVELQLSGESTIAYYVLWSGVTIWIYILGHIGLYRFGILKEQVNIQKYAVAHKSEIKLDENWGRNEYIIALEDFIVSQRNYLDSSLSLEMVADKLNLNKSYLSRLINLELGKSFTDYVNELRVEEAKSYIANPDFWNYTLVSIGLEAGFNSKSAFNLAFKKFTGLTPSEYKEGVK